MDLINKIDFRALKETGLPYLESLKDFNFSYLNPLFWAFFVLLFLILSGLWQSKKKSFSFCLIIAIVLLAATKVEGLLADALVRPGETFDPLIIRVIYIFIISIVFLYYAVIKDSL